jgi:hypothetical protein
MPLNGPLVELGEFADLRRQGARSPARVSIGCELWVDSDLGYVRGGPASGVVRWLVELGDPGRGRDPGRAVIRGVELEVPASHGSSLAYRAKRQTSRGHGEPHRAEGSHLQGVAALPGRVKLARRVGGRSVFATQAAILRAGIPVSIVAAGDHRSADSADDSGPQSPASEPRMPESARRRIETGGRALARALAGRVLHLGPLRQDPQLLYLNTPSPVAGFVGPKGERAFALLHRSRDRMGDYAFADGSIRRVTLQDALDHWLAELGVGLSITTVHRPRLGLEPELRMEGLSRALSVSAVGVGVSQVLPVLVMGLAAEPGSVLLLEQPELHLHPAVQQRLADFLLACVRAGRQVIVETHSDHLLTRIRRRVAEDPSDRLAASVAVVFTDRRDGVTRFEKLATNRYGGLDQWPPGFFDEAARDARELLEAGLRKREADETD